MSSSDFESDIQAFLEEYNKHRHPRSVPLSSGFSTRSSNFYAHCRHQSSRAPIISETESTWRSTLQPRSSQSSGTTLRSSSMFGDSQGTSVTTAERYAREDEATTIHSSIFDEPNEDLIYPCEFIGYTGCSLRFGASELDHWIEHIATQHLYQNFPLKSLCWFCDSAKFTANDPSQAEGVFRNRMMHIAEHINGDTHNDLQIRPDFPMFKHLVDNGLVDPELEEVAKGWRELRMPDFLVEAEREQAERSLIINNESRRLRGGRRDTQQYRR